MYTFFLREKVTSGRNDHHTTLAPTTQLSYKYSANCRREKSYTCIKIETGCQTESTRFVLVIMPCPHRTLPQPPRPSSLPRPGDPSWKSIVCPPGYGERPSAPRRPFTARSSTWSSWWPGSPAGSELQATKRFRAVSVEPRFIREKCHCILSITTHSYYYYRCITLDVSFTKKKRIDF